MSGRNIAGFISELADDLVEAGALNGPLLKSTREFIVANPRNKIKPQPEPAAPALFGQRIALGTFPRQLGVRVCFRNPLVPRIGHDPDFQRDADFDSLKSLKPCRFPFANAAQIIFRLRLHTTTCVFTVRRFFSPEYHLRCFF